MIAKYEYDSVCLKRERKKICEFRDHSFSPLNQHERKNQLEIAEAAVQINVLKHVFAMVRIINGQ